MNQETLVQTILAFIESDTTTENEFNELAIELFAYQYANNLHSINLRCNRAQAQEWQKHGETFRLSQSMLSKVSFLPAAHQMIPAEHL